MQLTIKLIFELISMQIKKSINRKTEITHTCKLESVPSRDDG